MLDELQAAIIAKAGRNVQILDPKGINIVGFVIPAPSPEESERARARLAEGPNGQVYTTQQVLAHLQSLERS
ncbi:MAG TPA: hypothetical protein VGX76_24845 [Pirellulales bacterium]|nr:hypothetical protein [Pirellulales bacterium]